MRILFITSEIPYPPDNGVRIVSYNAIRLMARQGHQLALAVLSDQQDQYQAESRMAKVAEFCEITRRSIITPKSKWGILLASLIKRRIYFMQRYWDRKFAADIRKLVALFQPDVVHFDLILMTQYRHCVPKGIGTIASINDSETLYLENAFQHGQYHGWQRWYRKFQLHQVRNFERDTYPLFEICHTMTEIDAGYLRKLNSNIRTAAIPNGVDTEIIYPCAKTQADSSIIIFVAKLVGNNVDCLRRFLEEGWGLVCRQCPQAVLRVAGRISADTEQLFPLAEKLGSVEFTGYVEDLGEVYRSCGIAVVPINKECGLPNKIIEAMVSGLCVIAFRKTFSGIPVAQPGRNCISVDNYKEMGQAICDLLRNREKRVDIQQTAANDGLKHYSWQSRAEKYEAMYRQARNIARGAKF